MMDSINTSSQVTVKYCSECDGNTAYYCLTCERDLCPPCKRTHNIERHQVSLYKNKNGSLLKSESCTQHPEHIYKTFCETCECPVCPHCKEHNQHTLENLETAYEKKNKLEEEIIRIRSHMLYNAPVLASGLKNNVSSLREEMIQIHSSLVTNSQRLKEDLDAIASVKKDLLSSIYQQIIQMYIHVAKIQKLLHVRGYTKAANKSVQILQFIRIKRLSEILNSPYISQQVIAINDLIKVLTKMSLYFPISQKPVKVACLGKFDHIFYVTPDNNWSSTLRLIDLDIGGSLHTVHEAHDPFNPFTLLSFLSQKGFHAVHSQHELFYIDTFGNVRKLSANQNDTTLVLQNGSPGFTCLHCSPFSDDLLISIIEESVAIVRCDKAFKQIQFIYQGDLIYDPCFISENKNGDIVVSDHFDNGMGVFVVIDCQGNHRFSYSRTPSGSNILPAGICTDAMSHILLCDMYSCTVQILSKNGIFLSYFLTKQGVYRPTSLCYDFNTHLLWVESQFSAGTRVSVFRYATKHLSLAGKLYMNFLTFVSYLYFHNKFCFSIFNFVPLKIIWNSSMTYLVLDY